MKRIKAFDLVAGLFLTIAWGLVASRPWGSPSLGRLVLLTITGWMIAAIVLLAARSVSHIVWIFAGATLLALLSLPDHALSQITTRLPHPLEDAATFTFLLALPMAMVVAALLLYSGLRLHRKRQHAGLVDDRVTPARRRDAARASVVALVLSALVLVKALHTFYGFMVWDSTGDSLGMLWLGMPVLSLLFSSALLSGLLPGNAKLAGLSYLLSIPLMILLAARAQSVDFRRLTEARADRARQAIEAYYAREGRYARDLGQLTPWLVLSLPGPVVIYAQSWCYQGGEDYYRLGYLDREHWSSPILFGRVYSTEGHSPLRVDVCQAAIDAYRAQHPDWDRILRDYGRSTPTPDVGD